MNFFFTTTLFWCLTIFTIYGQTLLNGPATVCPGTQANYNITNHPGGNFRWKVAKGSLYGLTSYETTSASVTIDWDSSLDFPTIMHQHRIGKAIREIS